MLEMGSAPSKTPRSPKILKLESYDWDFQKNSLYLTTTSGFPKKHTQMLPKLCWNFDHFLDKFATSLDYAIALGLKVGKPIFMVLLTH